MYWWIDPGIFGDRKRPPLKGNGWYTTVSLKFLLSRNVIRWDMVKWVVRASHQFPPDYLVPAVKALEEVGSKSPISGKKLVNSMIGVFQITETWNWRWFSGRCRSELLNLSLIHI